PGDVRLGVGVRPGQPVPGARRRSPGRTRVADVPDLSRDVPGVPVGPASRRPAAAAPPLGRTRPALARPARLRPGLRPAAPARPPHRGQPGGNERGDIVDAKGWRTKPRAAPSHKPEAPARTRVSFARASGFWGSVRQLSYTVRLRLSGS